MKKITSILIVLTMLASLLVYVPVMAEDMTIELGKEIKGHLWDQTEANMYRFKLETNGNIEITFEYPTSAPNSAWQVMLYMGNTAIKSEQNVFSGAVSGERRKWKLDPIRVGAGDYFVLVKSPNSRTYTNDSYNLTVDFTQESLDEYEKETNNGWTTAYNIPLNKEIKGNVAYAKDWDFVKIPLEFDGTIEVSFKYPENYEGSGWTVSTYNVPKGAYLIENKKTDRNGKAKDGYCELNFRKLRVAKGTYGILVGPIDGADLSDEEYILTVKVVDESTIPHEKEKNNDFKTANEIKFNTKTLASIEAPDDMDYSKFTLSEASDVKLCMYYPEGEQQQSWEMVLFNEKGERLGFTFNNNAGELTDGMKVMTLSNQGLEAGTYYVSVRVPVGGTHSYSDYYLMVENKKAPITNSGGEVEYVDEQLSKTGVPTVMAQNKLPKNDYPALSKITNTNQIRDMIARYVASLKAEKKASFAAGEKVQDAAEYVYTVLAKAETENIIDKTLLDKAISNIPEIELPKEIVPVKEEDKTVSVTAKGNSVVIKADCARAGVNNVAVNFGGATFKVPVKNLKNDVTVGLGNNGESFDVTVSGSEDVKIIIPSKNATVVNFTDLSGNTSTLPAFLTPDGKVQAPVKSSGSYSLDTKNVAFSDISGLSAEMQKAITDMANRGVINGIDVGKFDPSGLLTRAQTVKLIVAALGLEDKNATENFSDVKESDWHHSFVATGAKYGFVNGYPDGTFAPDATIAKQELVKVFAEVMKTYGGYKYPDNAELYLDFKDKETIGDWAKTYMAFGAQSEILPLRADGKVEASSGITRAEAALMLYRMFELL